MKRIFLIGAFILVLASGCSSNLMTNTPRSAIEQALINRATQRALDKAQLSEYSGFKVFIDYDYLAPQVDKQLVQGYLELVMARQGILVSRTLEDSKYIVQIHSGVLATDMSKFLLGVPSFPVPIPSTSLVFQTPELAFFAKANHYGVANFSLSVLRAEDRSPVKTITNLNALTKYVNWTVFFVPFHSDNISLRNLEQDVSDYYFSFE